MFKKTGLMNGVQLASIFIIIIPMIFRSLGVQPSTFSISLGLVVLVSYQIKYLQMAISLKLEYRMVLHFIETPNPNFPFFS